MRNTLPRWEEVATIGLASNHNEAQDNNIPGAFTVHCYRSPSSNLHEAPFSVELENFHTGEKCTVTISQDALLSVAHAALTAATRGVPVDCTPSEYFHDNGEVA